MKYLKYLLIFVPVSIVAYFMQNQLGNTAHTIIFFSTCLAIVPLAGYLGIATEQIASRTGEKLGGFLNATFGNATELIIGIFALKNGLIDVVKASLVGSVLGNILLVLGCSILAGGLKNKTLKFDAQLGSFTSNMLLFAAVSLSIPAIFTYQLTEKEVATKYISFSVIVSVIMLALYIVGLLYSFKTQNDLYGVEHAEDIEPKGNLILNIIILAVATIFIAIESELLVDSIEPMTHAIGIPEMFIGLILIPIVGNAAEHSTAIIMALKNKMDISIEIAVGSSLQIALFVIPLMVIISLFFPTHMSIILKPMELALIGISVYIANKIVSSGRTNWVEGLKLVSIYIILSVGFFVIPM